MLNRRGSGKMIVRSQRGCIKQRKTSKVDECLAPQAVTNNAPSKPRHARHQKSVGRDVFLLKSQGRPSPIMKESPIIKRREQGLFNGPSNSHAEQTHTYAHCTPPKQEGGHYLCETACKGKCTTPASNHAEERGHRSMTVLYLHSDYSLEACHAPRPSHHCSQHKQQINKTYIKRV
ncbi:hypothetical protein V6N13_096762 [Hibiscus sabdariffa]